MLYFSHCDKVIAIFCLETNIAPIAQSVEQLPFKQMVAGSIPAGRTIHNLVGLV